jgi:hypothetical protein
MSLNPDLYYGQGGDSDICIRIRPYKLSASPYKFLVPSKMWAKNKN